MKILLDTRDLINAMERGLPISADELETYLRAGNHEVVLSNTSVREFAGPLARGGDFMRLRPLLQRLESIPHTYVKEVTIVAEELAAAAESFLVGGEPADIRPFVDRWDRTMLPLRDGRPGIGSMLVGLRLDEIVHAIYRSDAQLFAPLERYTPALRALLNADRELLRTGQAPAREQFVRSVKKHAARHGVRLPEGREDEFGEWIYANPDRCPGLRLSIEVFRALTANYGDLPEPSDFGDLSQIFVVPYVDVATLDNRIRAYVRSASRKIVRMGGTHNFIERIFGNVSDVVAAFPTP